MSHCVWLAGLQGLIQEIKKRLSAVSLSGSQGQRWSLLIAELKM
jgi:hypothetical protein